MEIQSSTPTVLTPGAQPAGTVSPSSTSAGTQAGAPATGQAATPETEYVPKSAFDAVLQRLDGLSATVNRLGKQVPPVPESPKTKTDPIQAQLDELKREREQDRLERITDSLSIELAKRGVDAKRAAREAKLLKMEHGDKLTLDDSRQVIFRHSDTQETPLSTWLDAWLQSDEGRFILPSKATPRSPGIVPGRPVSSNAQTVQLSGSVLRGVNPADIVSGKIVVAS